MMETPQTCPIPATHDKFDEAHFFLHGLMNHFHEPEPFRWNLNAFLQALRSIRDMLEAELRGRPNFEDWYSPWKKLLDNDELIQSFRRGRNIIVHRGMLQRKSQAQAGAFRGDILKTAIDIPIDINLESRVALYYLKEQLSEFVGGENHPFIGEQLGIRRTWIVNDLGKGDEDVFVLCNRAWCKMSEVVSAAHKFVGSELPIAEESNKAHDLKNINLLLESDLDPTLPEQWGWE